MNKEKKRFGKLVSVLNSKPVIGLGIFIMLSLAMVFAGNVIVKDGSLDVGKNLTIHQTTPETEAMRIETTDTPINPSEKVYQGAVQTVNSASPTAIFTLPLTSGKAYQIEANIIGADSGQYGSGAICSRKVIGTFVRFSGGSSYEQGSETNIYNSCTFGTDMVLSGNNAIVRVTGSLYSTVDWTSTIRVYETNIGDII